MSFLMELLWPIVQKIKFKIKFFRFKTSLYPALYWILWLPLLKIKVSMGPCEIFNFAIFTFNDLGDQLTSRLRTYSFSISVWCISDCTPFCKLARLLWFLLTSDKSLRKKKEKKIHHWKYIFPRSRSSKTPCAHAQLNLLTAIIHFQEPNQKQTNKQTNKQINKRTKKREMWTYEVGIIFPLLWFHTHRLLSKYGSCSWTINFAWYE